MFVFFWCLSHLDTSGAIAIWLTLPKALPTWGSWEERKCPKRMGWRGRKTSCPSGATVALSILFQYFQVETLSESFRLHDLHVWFTCRPFEIQGIHWAKYLPWFQCVILMSESTDGKRQRFPLRNDLKLNVYVAEFNLLVTSINFTRKSSLGCQKRMYPSLLACPVWFCKTFAWNLTPRGKIYPFMVMAYWPGKIRRLILYMHCGQEFGHLLGKKLLNWNWWCNCCFRFHFFDDRQFVVYKTARIHAHFRNEIHLKSRIHVFDLHISSCFLLKRVF